MQSSYWSLRFTGARRVAPADDLTAWLRTP